MIAAASNFLAGFVLRAAQVLVDSSLYLVIGCLTAGALRAMARPAQVRGWFGTGRVAAPVRAWLTATTLLPVCALGVLPVARQFRRMGVARHAVLTFALAAPMLNPITLISGISYLGPTLILWLLAGTMVVAVGAGVVVGPGPGAADAADPADAPPAEAGRLAAAAVQAARAATGPALVDVAAGLIGAAAMAAALEPGYLAESLFDGDRWAIGRMAAIAPLTYASPDKGLVTLPEMIKFRQSAGAMFVLMALGVGMTLGHATWAARTYGARVAVRWLVAAVALTLVVAHGVAGITPAVGTKNADNDHFNEFANPFHGAGSAADVVHAFARFARDVEPFRWVTLAGVGALVAAGVYCRATGKQGLGRAARPSARPGGSAWDRPIPPRVVAGAGVGLGLAVAVAGVYAYFPAPAEVFQDMNIIKADFYGELGLATLDPARHHLDLWERQAAKLATGARIRFADADADAPGRTEELQAALRTLRARLDAGKPDEARNLSLEVARVQARCRQAYRIP